jgi:hypothetical protein
MVAKEFRDAACKLKRDYPHGFRDREDMGMIRHPLYFLFCRSIELGFKAFLRGQDYSEKVFRRKLSHDLMAGYEAAIGKGLQTYFQLTPEEMCGLQHVNSLYAEKDIEYPQSVGGDTVGFDLLEQIATRLLNAISDYCERNKDRYHNTPLAE